jgi:hypothetical protein
LTNTIWHEKPQGCHPAVFIAVRPAVRPEVSRMKVGDFQIIRSRFAEIGQIEKREPVFGSGKVNNDPQRE